MSLAAQLPETHGTAPGASASVSPTYTRRTLLGLGALSALPGCARLTLEQAPPVALPGTRCIDVASGDHTHRIMLAVPPAAPPPQGWPVLYVLDGDLVFALAAQLMRNRFARGPGAPAQGAVVVGLGYAGDRVLDLDAHLRLHAIRTRPCNGQARPPRGRSRRPPRFHRRHGASAGEAGRAH